MIREQLERELERYWSPSRESELAKRGLGAERLAEWVWAISPEESPPARSDSRYAFCFSGLVHGNELVGVSILNGILDQLEGGQISLPGPAVFLLGNVPAAREDQRYVERDLNRCFGRTGSEIWEDQRARVLEPIITQCEMAMDFHQVREPTHSPFFIFRWSEDRYRWARTIGDSTPIVSYEYSFSEDGQPLGEYLIDRNILALTLESGQAGFDEKQADMGLSVARSMIQNYALREEKLRAGRAFEDVYKFSQVIPNKDGKTHLEVGFENFASVSQGQKLAVGEQGDILAENDGLILFPRYKAQLKTSSELCYLISPWQPQEKEVPLS